MSKKPLDKDQNGRARTIFISFGIAALSVMFLGIVLLENGVDPTVCYAILTVGTVMCFVGVAFFFFFYRRIFEYHYNKKSQMLEETPCEQLTGVTRESIKQACLENGFKNKDSLYYHRRGSSVLKENVNYFVKTVECTDLQSALEKEFEAFDAKGYKNDNKCLMLFLFKEGLTEDEIDQALDASRYFILQETTASHPCFDTAVVIPVDTTTKTAYYLPFSSRTAVYTYGIKMLKKLTSIS